MLMKFYNKACGVFMLFAFLLTMNGWAQSIQKTAQGLKFAARQMDISVEFYSENTVRVYKTPIGKPYLKTSLSVVAAPNKVAVRYAKKGQNLVVKSSKIQVEVNVETGGVYFYDTSGKKLL